MKFLHLQAAFCGLLLSASLFPAQAQTTHGLLFRSTEGNLWQLEEAELQDQVIGTPEIILQSDQVKQNFKGWGTCFNELGYDALMLLPEEVQRQVMQRMFAPDGDLRFTIGRIPVGASDYGRSWYSCDETPDNEPDFNMEHFTIERDKEAVIPYIKFAQNYNPDMTFWASPWSPPAWMKTNKNYANAKGPGSDVDIPVYFNDQFIMEPDYMNAYCLYFSKFIDAYKGQGIPITTLMYQNEAYSFKIYPACSWTAQGTGTFLGEYLGPYFAEHHPDVELIVGTMNTGSMDVFEQILQHPGVQEHFAGIGLQWEGRAALPELAYRYPEMMLQQTESECGSGTFDWNAGEWTFYLINQYVGGGCEKYTYWNAVLKDNGSSTWGWIQNSLVRVNSSTRTAEYTPEYYAFKHYSHFIAPGSQILKGSSTGTDTDAEVLAARTPDGAIIIVAGNRNDTPRGITLSVDGQYLSTTLPANSFSSYVFGDAGAQLAFLVDEAKATDATTLDGQTAQQLEEALEAGQALAGSEDETAINQAIDDLKNAIRTAQTGGPARYREQLQQTYDRAQALTAMGFAGKDAFTQAITNASNVLQNAQATGEQLMEAIDTLNKAISDYLASSGATADTPADLSALIQNADFSDWANGWTQANVMVSGDCKAWTNFDQTCYNNWSDNFTSMDVYQDIEGLAPGWYQVSCRSLCGEGEITDQHAYATSGGVTAVSPVKAIGNWSGEGWEDQATEKILVGEDGKLRIGYASTSGGGTKGWYCVTDFKLEYFGTETDEETLNQTRQTLADLLKETEETLPSVLLAADKSRLQTAQSQAQAVSEKQDASLQELQTATANLRNALDEAKASNSALATYNNEILPAARNLLQSLETEKAQEALQDLIDYQEAQISADNATADTVRLCTDLLQASLSYFPRLEEALNYTTDMAYAENERKNLQQTIEAQTGLLPQVDQALAFTDLVRQLDEAIMAVRLTQLPGDLSDYTFAIRSADLETFGANGDPLGWELSLTNGDAKVKTSQHYSGDTSDHYFDSYNATPGSLFYTGHQTVDGLPNGTYKLQCAARSSGEGAFITARTATQDLKQAITKQGTEGNDGGPIWENAAEGSAEKAVNGGKGYGWQLIDINGIEVTDHRLDIGFTNDSYLTGVEWTGTWFSADDFRLFYVSDKTTGVESALPAETGFRAMGGKGRIYVKADAPYQVYHLSGMRIDRTEGLAPGIYLVKCGHEVRKVQVQP